MLLTHLRKLSYQTTILLDRIQQPILQLKKAVAPVVWQSTSALISSNTLKLEYSIHLRTIWVLGLQSRSSPSQKFTLFNTYLRPDDSTYSAALTELERLFSDHFIDTCILTGDFNAIPQELFTHYTAQILPENISYTVFNLNITFSAPILFNPPLKVSTVLNQSILPLLTTPNPSNLSLLFNLAA